MVPGLITYTRQVLRDDNDKYWVPLPIQRTETKEDEKREEQQEPQRGQDQEDSSVRDTALDTPGLIVTPIYVKCVCVACSNIIK